MIHFLSRIGMLGCLLVACCVCAATTTAWGASKSKGVPPQVQLKLIWIQKFDSVPSNERSILNKPPQISAQMIRPILETEDQLIFFDQDGRITKRLQIPELATISISEKRNFVAMNSPDITPDIQEAMEKGDAIIAEIGAIVQVINSYGTLIYQFPSSENTNIELSNSGHCVEVDREDCSLRFFDAEGNVRKEYSAPFECIGEEQRFYGTFSGDGTRFLLYTTDYVTDEPVVHVYVILFDNSGNELWRKEIEAAKESSDSFGISETGDRIIVSDNEENQVWLIDGTGNVVKTFDDIRLVLAQVNFDPVTSEFLLNPGLDETFTVSSDGIITKFKNPYNVRSMAISAQYVATLAMENKGNKVVLNIYNREGALLLDRNLGGTKNNLKISGISFVDNEVVLVNFARETRYYRISLFKK